MTGSPPVEVMAGANPFVGPRPFEPGERLYGREREISELHFRLNAERIVLLHSPSGAGKSSLVQAGLLPLLGRSFDVWGPTRVNAEPAVAGVNRHVLSAVQGFEEGVPAALRRPVEELAGQTLAGYFEKRPRRRSAPANVVLLFDQFEEILTVDPLAVEAKHEFFGQLGELLRNPRIWALFALREDYLAPLDPYARQVPTHLKNRFRIDLLGLAAAREAMIEPAREGGRAFPAAGKLVTDLATMKVQQPDGTFREETGQHVEPVQLQVVCRRLWDAMPPEDLTIDEKDLERFGDVTQALAAYYADAAERAAAGDPGRERAIRDWFGDELITAGGIRGQVLREAGASGGLANELIDTLRATHLVRAEQRAGATWYELAHDRLIEPVTNDNAAWREKHLAEAQRRATLWERQGRPAGLLLAGEELAEGERWAADNEARLTDVERRFLAESRQAQEAAERERRQARRIRWLAVGATLTTLVAVVALVWAWRAYSVVKQEARLSASRELALQSSQLLDKQLDLALLLALEAGRIAPTIEARRSLLAAVQHNQRLWRFLPPGTSRRLRVAFRPDGSLLAAAGESGAIELWDPGTGRQLPGSPLLLDGAFEVRAVAFSPDGRWLAAGGKTAANAGRLGLWDVSVSPPRRFVTPQLETVVRSLAFCARGGETRLAWNTKDELSLWPLRGTEKPRVLQKGPRIARIAMTRDCARLAVGHEWTGAVDLWTFTGSTGSTGAATPQPLAESVPNLKTLAFDPAGRRLAAGGKGSSVSVWDLSTSQQKSLDARTPVRSLAFRPDGTVLAAAGDTGVVLFDLQAEDLLETLLTSADAAGIDPANLKLSKPELEAFLAEGGKFLLEQERKKPKPLAGHDGPVSGIAFNQAGDVLASAGEDGKLILWKPDTDQRLGRRLAGHGNPVWAVAFSPDSRSLVSAEGWRPGEDRTATAAAAPAGRPAVIAGSIRLWNLGTGQGDVLPGSPGPSRAVAFSPDGRSIAAGSRESAGGTLHLWQLDEKTGKAAESAQWNAAKPVNAVVFSPDGKSLFAAEGEDLVRWSIDQKPPRGEPVASHNGNIWSLLIRRATGSLLASDETGKVFTRLGAAAGDKAVLEPSPPAVEILAALAESPDGHFVAAASWEGGSRCVYLWEMPSGAFRGCLAGHQEPVSAVAFARDGSLISADDSGQLIVWDPVTRQEIGRVQHGSRINGLAASPDGRTLAAAASDHTVLLLNLDWKAAARDIAGRKLTQQECETWIHFEPKPPSCTEER